MFGLRDAFERGFVLGSGLLPAGAGLAERLEGAAATRCAAAFQAVARLPRKQRAASVATLARELLEPVPAELQHVHPEWVADALTGEMPALILAATAGLGAPLDELGRTLVRERGVDPDRVAAARLTPPWLRAVRRLMFGDFASPLSEPDGASAERPVPAGAVLLAEVTHEGARLVGISLYGAPPPVLARAMATVGSPWATPLANAARSAHTVAERAEARLVVSGAAAETRTIDPTMRLAVIGAYALGRILTDARRALVMARRLPLAPGRALLAAAAAPTVRQTLRV